MRRSRFVGFLCGLIVIARAQVSDVPQEHWAYQAIQQLIELGIIEGYPEGVFQPTRPLTRAEFAQAVARFYRGLDERLRLLTRRIEPLLSDSVALPSVEPQQHASAEARAAIQELQRLREATETLQRLARNFEAELTALRPAIETLKRELEALQTRLADREKATEVPRLTGDFTVGALSTHSLDGASAFTLNNTPLYPSGKFLESINLVQELGLNLNAPLGNETAVSTTFIVSTYMPYTRGAVKTSYFLPRFAGVGRPVFRVEQTDFVVWEAFLRIPVRARGIEGELLLGRYPIVLTPFTIRRGPPEFYLLFDRYRDTRYRFDGGMLNLRANRLRLRLWVAQLNGQQRANQALYMPVPITNHASFLDSPNATVEQLIGARLEIDALRQPTRKLTVGATYFTSGTGRDRNLRSMQRIGNTFVEGVAAANINRIDLFGADVQTQLGRLRFSAEYAQANYLRDATSVLSRDSWALDASLNYEFSRVWSLSAGYREIRPYFGSLGSWGRIGYLFRPSDFRGLTLSTRYAASPALGIALSVELYEGTGKSVYRTDDKLTRAVAELEYRFAKRWRAALNYEGVFWRVSAATANTPGGRKPTWNYYTLGLAYDVGQNTTLAVTYQLIETDGKGFLLLSGGPSPNRNRGAVAATTLRLKF